MRTHLRALDSRAVPRRQDGAVLIVALLFLVILTMLGVTAMSGTTMEERMSGNTRDTNIALHAAETALRDARRDIMARPLFGLPRGSMHTSEYGDANGADGTCSSASPGLCRHKPLVFAPNGVDVIMPETLAIEPQTSSRYGQFTGAPEMRSPLGGSLLAAQPRYVIEHFCLPTRTGDDSMGEIKEVCKFFRITSRGWGVNPNSQVTLQEMFDGS